MKRSYFEAYAEVLKPLEGNVGSESLSKNTSAGI